MQITRTFKATILASILAVGTAQALPFLSVEAGGMLGANFDSVKNFDFGANTAFSYGAYGRVWLKPGMFRIAPFVKWENTTGISLANIPGVVIGTVKSTHNIQYGGLLGVEFFNITPYVGLAYSQFAGDNVFAKNTWALNYGVKVKIPVLPITLGIDGSYQKPEILGATTATKIEMHRVSATLGFQF